MSANIAPTTQRQVSGAGTVDSPLPTLQPDVESRLNLQEDYAIKAARQSLLEEVIMGLTKTLSETENCLADLRGRLSPVMHDEGPRDSVRVVPEDEPSCSPVVSELRRMVLRLNDCNESIREFNCRLEV